MTNPEITVYGAFWCPDCRRSKQFLGEHQIPYNWVNIEEDKEAEQFVIATNDGKRIIPTIMFGDGTYLTEPSNADLAKKLGLKLEAECDHYDLIVVGGGPAGLTAALYAAREAISVLVVERAAVGGQAAATEKLDNMPGFPDSVGGGEFAALLRRQAEQFGVEILQAQEVTRVHTHDNYHSIHTDDGSEYTSLAMVVATGSKYKRLGAEGETDYIGAGVHFCATCDGPFYRGKHVAVIGGGNSATEESLHLTKFADKVTMVVRGGEFTASQFIREKVVAHPQIEVLWHHEVKAFKGKNSHLSGLQLVNNQTNEEAVLDVDGSFIFIGLEPNSAFLVEDGILLDKWGFVLTGHELVHIEGFDSRLFADGREPMFLETNIPGVFAAGDVRAGSTKQVASAAGEGVTAALLVREYLKHV
ncbi:MAG TPA: FAD-dependent oxidoreductase [Anaerolineae bacterium]|nr:FAD-dependent oxidoreductase [Anaerolineae bacterium]